MPQFSFSPESVASGAPPAGVQSGGQRHNRVPAPQASRDAAQVGDHLDHRSCQVPAVGPFRAETYDAFPPLPFRESGRFPPWGPEPSGYFNHYGPASNLGPLRTGPYSIPPESRNNGQPNRANFSLPNLPKRRRGVKGNRGRGRGRGRGNFGGSGRGRGNHGGQSVERDDTIKSLRDEVESLKKQLETPKEVPNKGAPKISDKVTQHAETRPTVDRASLGAVDQLIQDIEAEKRAEKAAKETSEADQMESEPTDDAALLQIAGLKIGPEQGEYLFDSHFHLDRLNTNTYGPKKQYMTMSNFDVFGGSANFCDPMGPNEFPPFNDLVKTHQENKNTKICLGIHPTYSQNYRKEDFTHAFTYIEAAQREGIVSGFGEFGFDFLKGGSPKNQMKLCEDLLEIADPKLPLILHIRGDKSDPYGKDANKFCFSFLTERIEKNRCIQLHCFNGDLQCVHMWRTGFPNAYFSFSGMVKRFDNIQKEALSKVPLARMLIETDSPYFALEGKRNTPNQLEAILELVANIKGISKKDMILANIYNADKVFKLF